MWRKEFLLLPFILFMYSANQDADHEGVSTANTEKKSGESAIFLKYEGSITGQGTISIDQRIEIDANLGLRFDSELHPSGSKSFSHIVIFYQFANPDQCILYNMITKSKQVLKRSNMNDNSPDVTVVKKEVMYGYDCTHLRQVSGGKDVFNYWMSPNVPGYKMLMNVINAIKADEAFQDISSSIFKWGGIVKLNGHAGNSDVQLNLELTEAVRDTSYLATDFMVPSK
jgi:hypothetical protein